MTMDLNRTCVEGCNCGMAVCRCPVQFIVFYSQDDGEWIVERTEDKVSVARGSLEDMMALVTGPNAEFPGRRAHWAEDSLRFRFAIFYLDAKYPV
jgi:hypothetical protein